MAPIDLLQLLDEQFAHGKSSFLGEDEETGAKRYRYVRTGADHFSLAFTYASLAVQTVSSRGLLMYMRMKIREQRGETG